MNISLTNGNIYKGLVYFAAPILLGNLFQQFYSLVDTLIVGKFLGSNALAAVSSSGSLSFLLIGFFQGVGVGGGVLISRFYGSKDHYNLEKAVHVTVAFGLIVSVLLTVVGVIITPFILQLMNTPASVMPESVEYFKVLFYGSFGIIMYNTLVGVIQAVGDSKRPLYYLVIASIINVVLDLLFIAVFKMGVGSAALATAISQIISSLLCFVQLIRTKEAYRLNIKRIRIEKDMLIRIVELGLPAGVQNSIISFANTIVQSNINSFGELAMAGCGAYSKIEGFAFLPISSISLALTTFIGQNLGAGNLDRIKKGCHFGLILSMVVGQMIGIVLFINPEYFIRIFDTDKTVIYYGVLRIQASSLFFFVLSYSQCISAILRGAGRTKLAMYVSLICWCVIRISILNIAMPIYNNIAVVNYVYPITWTLSSICFYLIYRKVDFSKELL